MDLVELRIFAAAGILAVGVVTSTLAVTGVAVAGWIGRRWRARAAGSTGSRTLGRGANLAAERGARC